MITRPFRDLFPRMNQMFSKCKKLHIKSSFISIMWGMRDSILLKVWHVTLGQERVSNKYMYLHCNESARYLPQVIAVFFSRSASLIMQAALPGKVKLISDCRIMVVLINDPESWRINLENLRKVTISA